MSLKVISHCRLPLQHSCFFSWLRRRRGKKKWNTALTEQMIWYLEKQWQLTPTQEQQTNWIKKKLSGENVQHRRQAANRQGMTVRSCKLHSYLLMLANHPVEARQGHWISWHGEWPALHFLLVSHQDD